MPVEVSLLQLVSVHGTRHLWPEKFEALIERLEEQPRDRTQLLVIADWLKENDEPVLEDAFRWVAARENTYLTSTSNKLRWEFRNLPGTISMMGDPDPSDITTAAGAVAVLAWRLGVARERARKQLEELS